MPTNSSNYPLQAVTANSQNNVVYLDVNLSYREDTNPLTVANDAAIRVKIINLLYTSIGSRPFEPEFGSIVPTLIFSNINPNSKTAFKMESAIYTAINRWIPEITVTIAGIIVTPIPAQTCYFISINYTIISTGVPSNLSLRYTQ